MSECFLSTFPKPEHLLLETASPSESNGGPLTASSMVKEPMALNLESHEIFISISKTW